MRMYAPTAKSSSIQHPKSSIRPLLSRREMGPAVLLPAGLIRVGALRTLLPVADRLQPGSRHPQLDQEFLGRRGAPVAQAEIVFGRAPFVAMPFDDDRRAGKILHDLLQRVGIPRQRVAGV